MRVENLEDLLARLPSDLLVHVQSYGGVASHIDCADKRPATRRQDDGPHPPSLILRGNGPGWWGAEPTWGVSGRWPRGNGLPRAEPVTSGDRVCPCCLGAGRVPAGWPKTGTEATP